MDDKPPVCLPELNLRVVWPIARLLSCSLFHQAYLVAGKVKAGSGIKDATRNVDTRLNIHSVHLCLGRHVGCPA